MVVLSTEQQKMVDTALTGQDVIVDACLGSGKTSTIQALCSEAGREANVLYLTYSKLLKIDAQLRVTGAKVQNYHGIVYPSLLQAGINASLGESVATFNHNFRDISAGFPRYDLLVVDEYQDINEEYAQLLRNIKSVNPLMQTVFVGDMAQKVRSDTTLDVQKFVKEFCEDPAMLPFTQSFRAGPELGSLLGQAWNKPIVGVNTEQSIEFVSYEEAVNLIGSLDPGEVLALGKRNGLMGQALNEVEKRFDDRYNKNTVYASIQDSDSGVSYGPGAAVFTTFDSSKGLERPVSLIFDYDEAMWDTRNNFPDADPVVLRNIFLVAASRGKDRVVFVEGRNARYRSNMTIGYIPVRRFTELPGVSRATYEKPWWASDTFDFKYAENVEGCYELLDTVRLDDGAAEPIEINRNEGLIDLSPVVGSYQEAVFFDGYNAEKELMKNPNELAVELAAGLSGDAWHDALVLAAVGTTQRRYADQVTGVIPTAVKDALVARLGTQLPSDCQSQVQLSMTGQCVHSKAVKTPVQIRGVADAVHEGQVFELKFVTELSHAMFLQLGLYLVMGGYESGVLWNTRTDERWQVKVPDPQRFMNAVVRCVTKQGYRVFEAT